VQKLLTVLAFLAVFVFGPSVTASASAPDGDQVPIDYISRARWTSSTMPPRGHLSAQEHERFGISDFDSVPHWNKHFATEGFDPYGNPQDNWYYNMVGNPPESGGTTKINAPIVPVSLDLRNADGSPRYVDGHRLLYDVTPFVQLAVSSPVFQNANYSSSDAPTQFADSVQRAEFSESAKPDWHTLLKPSVKAARTMVLNRGTYRFALNTDGSCCFFVLVDADAFANAFFPASYPFDSSTPVGSAENSGDITTKDISTFLFPNTYLYTQHNPAHCCILGFHTYDFEPGTLSNGNQERRYILNYSSWITPGVFDSGIADVTAISHNMSETFNDPFVASDGIHNVTPWWRSPNGNCQNTLEVGDVIEGLPHELFSITMNGLTYHVQNEALLQWFAFESPSSALDGAYSYPNAGALQALSQVQKPGCAK
jgi:hypothetical protein